MTTNNNDTYRAACDAVAKTLTENPALIHAPKLSQMELMKMPKVVIDVPVGRPDVVELEVANAYPVREALKAAGYDYNGTDKTWYVFAEAAELSLWLEELKSLGVRTANCNCMSPADFAALTRQNA